MAEAGMQRETISKETMGKGKLYACSRCFIGALHQAENDTYSQPCLM